MKIAINGFGRIGRCVMRGLIENSKYDNIDLAVVNSTSSIADSIHLLKYDSIFGRTNAEIEIKSETEVKIGKRNIKFISEKDPNKIDWKGIDVIMECTGKFLTRDKIQLHLDSGAKQIMLSAPAKDKDIPMIVYGINHQNLSKKMDVFSIGSCTTNCLAPIAKVLDEKFGIASGFMTTVHSYTGDQNLVDGSHKDLRRARSAAMSMVPTSTGAAKSISLVLPNLEGKLDGAAIRVPTANVSVVDLVVNIEKNATIEDINNAFIEASNSNLKGILGIESAPLVSTDFTQCWNSSTVDLLETKVIGKNCVRVLSWYDNEWAFSMRMLDLALLLV